MKYLQRQVLYVAIAGFLAATAGLLLTTSAHAGGACRGEPVTTSESSTVDLIALCFSPTITHVNAGDTVTWTNRDKALHTVTGANASWGDFTEIAPGNSVSHQFAAAGVYPYYCFLHPGMIGAIVVGSGAGNQQASAALEGVGRQQAALTPAAADGGSETPIALYAGAGLALVVILSAGVVLGRLRASG